MRYLSVDILLLKEVVEEIVHDGTLDVPSPISAACCKVATDFLNWSEHEENLTTGCVYAQTLVSNLCIAFSPPHNTHFCRRQQVAGRERMWALYHNIRYQDINAV